MEFACSLHVGVCVGYGNQFCVLTGWLKTYDVLIGLYCIIYIFLHYIIYLIQFLKWGSQTRSLGITSSPFSF